MKKLSVLLFLVFASCLSGFAQSSAWTPLFTQFPGYVYGTCTVASATTVSCPSGTVYNGGHSVTVTGATVSVAANKTDCTAPSYAGCNFIISNSAGTISVTSTLATASASGNTVLAMAETNAGGTAVTQLTPGWASGTPWGSAMLGNAPSVSQTLTTPVVTGGLTALGSGANDFSGSTGTFKTSTGVNTFGGEAVLSASTTALASANIPVGTAPTTPVAGDLWNDPTRKCITYSNVASDPLCISGTLIVLQPQTPITTVSTIQTMNSTTITIPAQAINLAGREVDFCGQFVFSNGVTTPTLTVTLKFNSVTLAAPVSSANANSNSSSPAFFCFKVTTSTTGASGTLEAHGYLQENVASGVAGAAMATFPDTVTAASSAVDLTANITVTVGLTVSSGPVTTATLRQGELRIHN